MILNPDKILTKSLLKLQYLVLFWCKVSLGDDMCEVVLIYEIKGSVFLFCMKGLVGAPQQCSEGEDWRRCKMGSGNLTCPNLEKPLKVICLPILTAKS